MYRLFLGRKFSGIIIFNFLFFRFCRRVHVTQEVANLLESDYEMEPGNGADRHEYLKLNNIKTYLIRSEVTRVK